MENETATDFKHSVNNSYRYIHENFILNICCFSPEIFNIKEPILILKSVTISFTPIKNLIIFSNYDHCEWNGQ